MSVENLRIYARAFYSDLMSGLITYELNNASEFQFLHGNIQKLEIEYLYNQIQLQTHFTVDIQKGCVLINSSKINTGIDLGMPERIQLLPLLDLVYRSGKIDSLHPPSDTIKDSSDQQVVFPVLHSGLFGQTFLSRVAEYFSEQEFPVVL
jgi:hypothetical protein